MDKLENVAVEPWAMSVVYQKGQAIPLSEDNARQASQLAERGTNGFEKYLWTYVPLAGAKDYIVAEIARLTPHYPESVLIRRAVNYTLTFAS